MLTESRPAAFFDIDNTLLNFNTIRSFYWFFHRHREGGKSLVPSACYMLMYRFLSIYRMIHLIILSKKHDNRMSANRAYYRKLKGVHEGEYKRIVTKWLNETKPESYINPQVMKRLREHQNRSHIIVLISGSHSALVRDLADHLQTDHLLATETKCRNGYLTGDLVHALPRVGEGKVQAMKELARQYGIDLNKSFAYSDHISDLPMLMSVGTPVAVIGDKRLDHFARLRGWEILTVDQDATRQL